MAAAGEAHSPIEQFEINTLIPLKLFGIDVSFTNSSLYMVVALSLITLFLTFAMGRGSLIPGRLQSMAEVIYKFVADTVRENIGEEGMKFFPLVFSLFIFVLVLNLLGMIPIPGLTFTVTSHIAITAALALLVIGIVIGYGLYEHGLGFFKLFAPSGVPGWLMPILVPIEVISFISRPISLSVRLFANMLAGHIALKIFAGFVGTLLAAGGLAALLAPLPLALTVALTALEVLVAVLQAYVFAVLTCIYLSDAVHGSH
ncbi:MAG: F0F1 ATP synthase subunit A [Hyphomicrobiaceae bacterium]|nr:F0F1 ATP synthase subunit A [Hyphomicrobiaceae bacterium]